MYKGMNAIGKKHEIIVVQVVNLNVKKPFRIRAAYLSPQ